MSTTTIARAVLTSGSAHEDVHALGRLLADAGHENSVSRGENPFGIVDDTIIVAVNNYRNSNGVDPEDTIDGVPAHERSRWIGPNLWAALCPELTEPETDEQRAEREQREAEAREKRAAELRAELAAIEGRDEDPYGVR